MRRSNAAMAVLALALVTVLSPLGTHGQATVSCVTVDFNSDPKNFCFGLGQLSVPQNLTGFFRLYQAANEPAIPPVANAPQALDLFNKKLAGAALVNWMTNTFGCPNMKAVGPWWKAMQCASIGQMAERSTCKQANSAKPLCADEIQAFFGYWGQAVSDATINKCANADAASAKWETMRAGSALNGMLNRALASPTSCFPGTTFEKSSYCGFPASATDVFQPCVHQCKSPQFAALLGGDPTAKCAAVLGATQPLPVLTLASAGNGSAAGADAPAAGGAASPTPAPGAAAAGATPTDTGAASGGFLNGQTFGLNNKIVYGGGLGALALVAAAVALVATRSRRSAATRKAATTMRGGAGAGSTPRGGEWGTSSGGGGAGSAPRGGAASPLPEKPRGGFGGPDGPASPTGEFGHYSPGHDYYGGGGPPGTMSPPPPGVHDMYAPQPPAGAYGNAPPPQGAGDYFPPSPGPQIPMGALGAMRPESVAWNAVPQRQSTRPPSMMPADAPRPRPVVLSYVPRLEDELEVHAGDQVTVWEEYGDGYAWGESWDGRQGVFPIMCLDDGGAPALPAPPTLPGKQGGGGADMQEGGVRETMINPQAYRFTQYTVASDFSDDDHHQPMPMQQQQQQYQQQQQQQGGGRW
ncbi:hypothetical protein BC828DRAFT_418370 [Blastocladiella britannica]|nr:hypothetical protein BC828DRAFT_418370 [Blastocladiella britannica]